MGNRSEENSIPSLSISPGTIIDSATQLFAKVTEEEAEITGEDLLRAEIKEIPFLVEQLFQQVGLACLAGSSDTGKSTLLRQLAIGIVKGDDSFLGFKLNAKHKSVIYVSTEDDKNATSYLLRKQFGKGRVELLKGLRFIFDTENLLGELAKRLSRKPADLVIIDCFADSFKGKLIDTQEIRTFLHPFQEIAVKHQCLILFLHHTGKRTEHAEPSKNNLLGGQGFEAKMRVVIELRQDLADPSLRHFCIVKANYLPARDKRESTVLKFDPENFIFELTGDSTPFELLIRNDNEDKDKSNWERAKELKDKGFSYEEIAKAIAYRSKGSVSKLFDRAKKKGWDQGVSGIVSTGNEGNK